SRSPRRPSRRPGRRAIASTQAPACGADAGSRRRRRRGLADERPHDAAAVLRADAARRRTRGCGVEADQAPAGWQRLAWLASGARFTVREAVLNRLGYPAVFAAAAVG